MWSYQVRKLSLKILLILACDGKLYLYAISQLQTKTAIFIWYIVEEDVRVNLWMGIVGWM